MRPEIALPRCTYVGCTRAGCTPVGSNRPLHLFFALLAAAVLEVPFAPRLAAADLAPTGTLRAAFLGDNPVQGRKDPKTGEYTGPVVDLTQELAKRLNVPYKITAAANARHVMDLVNSRQVDIGYLALDPERAKEVDFSAPYALMANTYVVRRDAPFQSVAEVDRAGVKVGAVKGQSQQLFLSSHLKNAQVRVFPVMPSLEELEKLIAGGEIDAFGANRQRMVDAAARFPSLRALPDNFSSVGQAIVLPKGERAKMDEINRFIYSVIESGLVKSSLERANNAGVLAAPGRK